MAQPPIVQKLQHYIDLDADDLALIARLSNDSRTVPAGADLLVPDARYTSAFLIHDGWALRARSFPDGRRQIINFLLPGDAFGLGALVLSRPDHQVSAITPLSVASITPDLLLELMRVRPRLGAAFLWSAAQEEAVLREHIISIGRRTAYERVSHLLLELMHRLQLIGFVEERHYPLPLSQPLLADALGLSVVHVNRTLRRLQREKLIAMQSRRITILDYEALQRIADFHRGYLHIPPKAEKESPLNLM